MLLVYTHKITPRLRYTFKHLCTRILGVPVSFTTTIEEFIAHDSLKMSYTKQPLSNEVFIRNHDLLFEQGLSDVDINVQSWNHTKCFFPTGEKSALPFDIFAASFYLLSRYEEYLPHVKDEYGRFTATESLAYKEHFLKQPVVDIWAYELKNLLEQRFEGFTFPKRNYKIAPVIDVPMAFYFKQKGLLRTVGGALNDLFQLKLRRFYQRFLVLFGFKRDPYDTFKWIINKQKQFKFKFVVFFLIGDYSTYDKNININKKKFVSLIKSVADYSKVGLKVSYFALDDISILKKEKKKIENITNYELESTRHSFSKINLPTSYRNLIELEVKQDFTMGYLNQTGFRAGTCTPFLFYDLDYETQTPLLVNSFHCIDHALLKHQSQLDKKQELQRLMSSVKQVNGIFTPVFHNYSFGNEPKWKGFRKLFTQILESVDEGKRD
ncbi:polysaccharide deacetylase family protein [Psychroserpens algicola]|uniref:Polysaccharide deacetylase family protein n=1 Tax=Psychroserpens algicola TaxID=1719034 RepID=A0ABT0H6P8_9FLAO|nr:polysaccharide deacetylase family protein [Psychroserpens algicola]MCK8480049.1 polysaccharide deacetylase family protein [Psychroserpens algicola]